MLTMLIFFVLTISREAREERWLLQVDPGNKNALVHAAMHQNATKTFK